MKLGRRSERPPHSLIENKSFSGLRRIDTAEVSLCSCALCALSVWEFLANVVRQVIFGRPLVSSLMDRECNSALWSVCFLTIENVRFQQQVVCSLFNRLDTYKGDSSSHSRHFCHTRQHTVVVLGTRSTHHVRQGKRFHQVSQREVRPRLYLRKTFSESLKCPQRCAKHYL